jgi:lipid-binding SYLF domain-containing protein
MPHLVKSSFAAAAAVLVVFATGMTQARAQAAQQDLVDRATLTLQEVLGGPGDEVGRNELQHARAVMICPRLFKAGFLFGGEGGGCVLVARDGAGSWSSPAFYGLGGGSIGLQIGIQDSELVMMILTERGLSAVMDSQFKIGADASVAIATIGAGVGGATTAALTADIVAFERARGLFAGASIQGTVLATDTNANRHYYGQDLAARQIVMQMQASNPNADPLRAALMRFGNPTPVAYAPPPAYQSPTKQPSAYAPIPNVTPTMRPASVQSTPLPPPH